MPLTAPQLEQAREVLLSQRMTTGVRALEQQHPLKHPPAAVENCRGKGNLHELLRALRPAADPPAKLPPRFALTLVCEFRADPLDGRGCDLVEVASGAGRESAQIKPP